MSLFYEQGRMVKTYRLAGEGYLFQEPPDNHRFRISVDQRATDHRIWIAWEELQDDGSWETVHYVNTESIAEIALLPNSKED